MTKWQVYGDYRDYIATIEVPEHLKNFLKNDHGVKYNYPHNFENGWVE